MTLRIGVIAVLLALAAATLIAVCTFGPREPTYHSKPLSYWIDLNRRLGPDGGRVFEGRGDVLEQQERDLQEARPAITIIGTNGLPYLIDWMRYQPPLWGARFISRAPRPLRRKLNRFNLDHANRAEAAMEALVVLGTNAAPAIPELAALAMKTNILDRDIARRAKITLSYLGPQAVPALMNLWSNAGPFERTSLLYRRIAPELLTNSPSH